MNSRRIYALIIGAGLGLALVSSGCNSKSSSNNGSGSSSGNGSGSFGRGGRGFGGAGGAFGGGSFSTYISLANPPTGVAVAAPAAPATPVTAPGTGTPTPPAGISEGGFRVVCTTDAGVPQYEMALALKTTDTAGNNYTTTLTYNTTCSDYANVTVSGITTGDQEELTVNLSTLQGKLYATGATAVYTQAAIAAPTAGSTGGFTRPTPTELSIAMGAPTTATTITSGTAALDLSADGEPE